MALADGITRWPRPIDPARGQDVAALYGASGPLRDLIAGTAGTSPYLHGILSSEHAWLSAAFEAPEAALAALMGDVETLRQDKLRLAGLVALLDLGGVWGLSTVTQALSDAADRATETALRAHLAPMQARGQLPDDPGLIALAMGKLGAGELNYSSDIDLILLMDDRALTSAEAGEQRRLLIKAARAAMRELSEVRGGYVFRTDLRLRPDAAVTPIVITTRFAEHYYESMGRTWERAAFIKARAAAGDIAAGEAFLAALTPFIWRRHLDYAAIEDAHDILLKIRAHHGLAGPITLPGHDMKLGRGGIREIEFFAQTRQLISGGRDPSLRPRSTQDALTALAGAGWVPPETAELLSAAYARHREVEHRLQMMRDAQTHDLPYSAEGMERLAALMGMETHALEAQLEADLEAVHALTEPFFAPTPARAMPDDEAPDFGAETTARWLTYPALRSPRAVRVFERLRPLILERLAAGAEPERALAHFDGFLAGLPAGVQVFSLFEANPQLIDLLTEIAAVAPPLAEYLGRNAAVLDAVIGGAFFAPWPGSEALTDTLSARLNAQSDYEAALDAARGWAREWHFRVGVHHLRGLIDAEAAGQQCAELAEAVLRALWPVVVAEFARKHGPPPGQGAVVVAMGSLGAGRLHAASDLDLILIYDADGQEGSDGPRPLATRPYYARLTQALVTALSAPMAQGRLYEVDLRLRPSGRNGPVAVSMGSWETYQRESAWTWEHLALTRARVLTGPPALGARVEAFRCALLAAPRDRAKVAQDVAEMRARIAAARPGEGGLSAKDGAGRLQDLELFAQTLALLTGSDAHDVAGQLAAGAALLSNTDALQEAARLLWQLRAASRLVGLSGPGSASLGAGGAAFLLRETSHETEAALVAALDQRATLTDTRITQALASWGAQAS